MRLRNVDWSLSASRMHGTTASVLDFQWSILQEPQQYLANFLSPEDDDIVLGTYVYVLCKAN